MSETCEQALANARRLVRTFGSAPEPRRRAQAVLSQLTRAEGWSAHQRASIEGFRDWLRGEPAVSALEPRCRGLLSALV
ncbi:hypothetical protein [Phenylobacterium sp.]|uniref:hypothetical protein n=1 Tax=Phenylobacterium sp. TaxID=1871053 RepID=UPI003BAA1EB3